MCSYCFVDSKMQEHYSSWFMSGAMALGGGMLCFPLHQITEYRSRRQHRELQVLALGLASPLQHPCQLVIQLAVHIRGSPELWETAVHCRLQSPTGLLKPLVLYTLKNLCGMYLSRLLHQLTPNTVMSPLCVGINNISWKIVVF